MNNQELEESLAVISHYLQEKTDKFIVDLASIVGEKNTYLYMGDVSRLVIFLVHEKEKINYDHLLIVIEFCHKLNMMEKTNDSFKKFNAALAGSRQGSWFDVYHSGTFQNRVEKMIDRAKYFIEFYNTVTEVT